MKIQLIFTAILIQFICCGLSAQQSERYALVFETIFINSVKLHSYSKINERDSIAFETVKFYISGIQFLYKSEVVWEEQNGFHLIDASNEKSKLLILAIPAGVLFNELSFKLGIDSLTSVSGAMGHDLDPTKGMYWAWQSGYINLKLEGKSNLCPTKKNEFQFHLGGYQFPYNALQTIKLAVKQQPKFTIDFDLNQFFAAIDLVSLNHIMSPGKDAVFLSKSAAQSFRIRK